MLNPSASQYEKLPYERLPQAASNAVFGSLTQFGFAQEAIVEEYSFSSEKSLVTVNALAFAHPEQRDLDDYASITVLNAVNGHSDDDLVKLLAESSAPFHLIHRGDKFSFWTSSVNADTQKRKSNIQIQPKQEVSSIAYERLGDVLSDYAVDLRPQRIIDVKQGRDVFKLFPYVNPLQLSLWAEEIRSKPLVNHFERAIQILRDHPAKLPNETITVIATQLLGILILTDTRVLGHDTRVDRPSLSRLSRDAYEMFPHYFDKYFLLERDAEAVEQAYEILQRVQYAGFVPDMLGDLYKVAYEQEMRRKLGNYDTPLYLTRRILDTIPVEYLPPHERVITDITCGWGSFLIAGYERLSKLDDAMGVSFQNSLYGNDYDAFFTRLAKLGLMHTTLRDDWHIDNENVFQWQWLKNNQPNIIVGNPPFAGNRKKSSQENERGNVDDRRRFEKANEFLRYAVQRLSPGGYLALIMPRSFAISQAGPQARKTLLEECDVLELWDLPEQVFEDVTARTMVVFAQKKPEDDRGEIYRTCVRTRTIQPDTLRHFKDKGIYSGSGLVKDQSAWKDAVWQLEVEKTTTSVLDYKTILPDSLWQTIQNYCVELQSCVQTTRGITIGTKRKDWDVLPKPVLYFPDARQSMPFSHKLDYTKAQRIIYPHECERPRLKYEYLFQGEKLLLQYVQTPSWGKRVKLAIERKGYYPANKFWVIGASKINIWLSYKLTSEILAAILEWDVSNAWIVEHLKSPDIHSYALRTIPIPMNLSEDDCAALTKAVLMLEGARSGRQVLPAAQEARSTIDQILKIAYHLDEATFHRLRQVREWESERNITLDIQPDQTKTTWSTSGIVDSVDAAAGIITLWIDGFDELQSVRIVSSMPGWMLRPGAAFLTKIPREYRRQRKIDPNTVDWGTFHPQPHLYMSEEELLIGFSRHFATGS